MFDPDEEGGLGEEGVEDYVGDGELLSLVEHIGRGGGLWRV